MLSTGPGLNLHKAPFSGPMRANAGSVAGPMKFMIESSLGDKCGNYFNDRCIPGARRG